MGCGAPSEANTRTPNVPPTVSVSPSLGPDVTPDQTPDITPMPSPPETTPPPTPVPTPEPVVIDFQVFDNMDTTFTLLFELPDGVTVVHVKVTQMGDTVVALTLSVGDLIDAGAGLYLYFVSGLVPNVDYTFSILAE